MDWGMAGLFWVLSAVCLMIAWHLRHADQLWFTDGDLYQQHGRRIQRLHWPQPNEAGQPPAHGELRLVPMGGLTGLLLIDESHNEFPLCTWRRRKICLDLAEQLNQQAPAYLPVTNPDGDEHEFARLRRQKAEVASVKTEQDDRAQ